MAMHLKPLNHTIKNVYNGSFCVYGDTHTNALKWQLLCILGHTHKCTKALELRRNEEMDSGEEEQTAFLLVFPFRAAF